jgi:hypothetical protein
MVLNIHRMNLPRTTRANGSRRSFLSSASGSSSSLNRMEIPEKQEKKKKDADLELLSFPILEDIIVAREAQYVAALAWELAYLAPQ